MYLNHTKTLCYALFAFLGMTTVAYASGVGSTIGDALCNIPAEIITGTIGRAIATIGVITLGLGALLGRITWGQALIVATGIAVLFGAASIVDIVSKDGEACEYETAS